MQTYNNIALRIFLIEIIGFLVVIMFIWLNELLDIPFILLGAPSTPVNIPESIIETIAIVILGVIVGLFTRYFVRRLQIAIDEKNKLLSIVSHDLRNSFTSLLGNSHVLQANITQYSPEQISELAAVINKSAKNLSHLLENLMRWAQLQGDKAKCYPQTFEVSELINSNIALFSIQAAQKNITITRSTEEKITIYADRTMVNSILQNLINNAIKYTPQNGRILITLADLGHRVNISVSDTGQGIEPSLLKKIFKADTPPSKVGTAGEKGIGLGLMLCDEFLKKNRGKISVESEIGKGSIFSFTLPKSL